MAKSPRRRAPGSSMPVGPLGNQPAATGFRITSLEGQTNGLTLQAPLNPTEITLTRAIPWQPQLKKGPGDLQFSEREAQTMAFELLFDGVETDTSVQGDIGKLLQMSEVDPILKRPPKLKVLWGGEGAAGTMPRLDAVIESLNIRYVMFDPKGLPLRAVVAIKVKEAGNLKSTKTGP